MKEEHLCALLNVCISGLIAPINFQNTISVECQLEIWAQKKNLEAALATHTITLSHTHTPPPSLFSAQTN